MRNGTTRAPRSLLSMIGQVALFSVLALLIQSVWRSSGVEFVWHWEGLLSGAVVGLISLAFPYPRLPEADE